MVPFQGLWLTPEKEVLPKLCLTLIGGGGPCGHRLRYAFSICHYPRNAFRYGPIRRQDQPCSTPPFSYCCRARQLRVFLHCTELKA